MIVTREPGDQYIIKALKFPKLYTLQSSGTAYISANHGPAVRIPFDFTFNADFGRQEIKAGGVLYHNLAVDALNGNQLNSFTKDFAREAANGDLIALTEPLANQLAWARQRNETNHIADIECLLAVDASIAVPV